MTKLRRSNNFKLKPLPIFDEQAVLELFESLDVKPLHARNLWRYLLRTPGVDIKTADLASLKLPAHAIQPLRDNFVMSTSRVVSAQHSRDGSVTKLLIELQDGLRVETVVIRNGATTARRIKGEPRTTLCISSQVGCKMGCRFCATGTMGEIGNLAMGEIVEQMIHARKYDDLIRNVVFMGMGEPMNNYSSVIPAARAMIDPARFQLSPNRVTISTVGVVPRMRAMLEDLPQVQLALSLHAPNQELREELVPTAKGYTHVRICALIYEHVHDHTGINSKRL
jgi:adenine C2-methylase RlmN of 23S rRNA A2503 and tRNA A37